MARALSYLNFYKKIDLDRFYDEIGFEVIHTNNRGDDIGHCPDPWTLHSNGDQTGKFAIHREKRVYHCWVCGGGTLLSLAMALTELDDEQATEWLYQFADETQETDEDFLVEIDAILHTIAAEKVVLPSFNQRVLAKWTLTDPALMWPGAVFDYLRERGISTQIAMEFGLGYGAVTKYAPRKKSGTGAGQPIDAHYTGPAFIFPHYWQGKLVGWQHRWMDDNRPKWCAKYTNTGDFPREETLFNLDRCLKSTMPPIIVESVPTVLYLASNEVAAIATFGSSIQESQMRLLRRFQQGVIVAPDNDQAGRKWAGELRRYLDRYIPVYELPPVNGGTNVDTKEDLGDLAQFGPLALWEHLDKWT